MTATAFGYLILRIFKTFFSDTPLCVVLSTPLSFTVFGNGVKHGLSCLIYYLITHYTSFTEAQFQ